MQRSTIQRKYDSSSPNTRQYKATAYNSGLVSLRAIFKIASAWESEPHLREKTENGQWKMECLAT